MLFSILLGELDEPPKMLGTCWGLQGWRASREGHGVGDGVRASIDGEEIIRMASVTIQEAQSTLTELIHRLQTGDEVVITENDRPVALLVSAPQSPPKPPRRLGTMKGSVVSMAPDFDAPLEDFGEYAE